MAGKKKKPAANPARGFATTSVASKARPEKPAEPVIIPEKKKGTEAPVAAVEKAARVEPKPVTGSHQPSPEELEAQLEHDDLQMFVETYAAKVRREVTRLQSRVQTDRRVLRTQSQYLPTSEWLPEDIMAQLLDLARAEVTESAQRYPGKSITKLMSEDDGTVKLWMLSAALKDLGFSDERIRNSLKQLCKRPPSLESTSQPWGLSESLDRLALECDKDELQGYDPARTVPVGTSTDTSRPETPAAEPEGLVQSPGPKQLPDRLSNGSEPVADTNTTTSTANSDVEVSDLESDLEPDELMSVYLKKKTRLFEIQPELFDLKTSKSSKKGRLPPSSGVNKPQASVVRKLQGQLDRIESDVLFDRWEADQTWQSRRIELLQERSSRRAEPAKEKKPSQRASDDEEDTGTATDDILKQATALGDLLKIGEDEDESTLLGGIFSAAEEAGGNQATQSPGGAGSVSVTIRDFGKQTGISPRRILAETLKTRDAEARVEYKRLSEFTYSSRHMLSITWSKDQPIYSPTTLPGIVMEFYPRRTVITMQSVATPSFEQSEAYVSVIALFMICHSLTKEDRSFLRLPPTWRDFYRELMELKQKDIDSRDRATVKDMRTIIQEEKEAEDEEDIVLTNGFRKRLAANRDESTSGTCTPNIGTGVTADQVRELWNMKSSTKKYQQMLQQRSNLPIWQFRDEALAVIGRNQVTILCGETGCGKSTQLPSFILEHELANGRECKIFCTEPRRISAISLAQRVSEELGESKNDLGSNRSLIGYAIRLESNTSATTRLIYATVGIVLRMLESSRGLREVTHLIIDEVHERSIDTDFLLVVLRSLMDRRPDLKVILMSATVDAQRFSKYLNNAPIITVPGRTFPVQTKFLEDAIEFTHYKGPHDSTYEEGDSAEDDINAENTKSGIPQRLPGYSAATKNALANYDEYKIDYELIVRLITEVASNPQTTEFAKAFLVFMPGMGEIRQLNDMLVGHPAFNRNWLIYPLHSTISNEDQQAAFVVPPPGVRKVVIATNIAETGITIPDITCVIDTGKHKEMRFDERRQLSRLVQSFISRANAKQRRGRAGRVQEGLCFHLFTKYRHDELMTDQQTPEMLRLSLQELVMRTKICKLGDIEETLSQALDPPSSKNIRRAIDALIEVDALTPGEELTPLGQQLAKLPLDAHLGKLVLLCAIFGCLDTAITIAATLSSKSPFITPMGARQSADLARMKFKKGDSDLLTAYNAYQSWKSVCMTPGQSEMQFCRKNYLSPQNLANIEDLKAQLLSSLMDAGFVNMTSDERAAMSKFRSSRSRTFVPLPRSQNENNSNELLVSTLIATAFYPKILVRDGKGWRSLANNQSISLHPSSVNKGNQTAPMLSYYHIMQSGSGAKLYNAHATTPVQPLPLTLLGGGDADWKLHAGVVTLDGNRLRFAVKDWKTAVALKMLRAKTKEIVQARLKNPTAPLGRREARWFDALLRIFQHQHQQQQAPGS